jgi:hypothetical protein
MECAGLIGASRVVLFFLTLADPVFLKQSPLAQTYPNLTRKHSSSCSCTSNVCHFSSLNLLTAGKLTKFPYDFIHTESPPDPNDTQLGHCLIVGKGMLGKGAGFERYLQVVMPSLLGTAGAKADLSLYRAFIPLLYQVFFTYSPSDKKSLEKAGERNGWETIVLDGQSYGVRTSKMDRSAKPSRCSPFIAPHSEHIFRLIWRRR